MTVGAMYYRFVSLNSVGQSSCLQAYALDEIDGEVLAGYFAGC